MTSRRLRRLVRIAPAATWAALIWWLSSTPDDGTTWLDLPWLELPLLDKVAHAGLFGVLAALLLLAGLRPLAAVLVATAWGGADELHQMFVPGRHPDLLDLVADASGAIVAAAAVRWLAARRWSARYGERPERRSEP